jgi:hypothetical protein
MTNATADPEVSEGICSKTECPANNGGACVDGIENKIDCDNFELTEAVVPDAEPVEEARVLLPDGEAVWPNELERLMRSHPVSTVVPLGRVGAGKTTLMAVAYHLLRSRRMDRWRFAGSETVIGFARRAFEASFASLRNTPTTGRTEREESGLLLHLDMRSVADGGRYPLVLSDLSGEHVTAIANGESVEVVREALARADHIPVVVDGAKLINELTRTRAVYEARTLLKMLEKYDLKADVRLCIVVTKGDLIADTDLGETVQLIVRDTLARSAPYFVTADRSSVELGEDGEPLVGLGDGVESFIQYVAQRPSSASMPAAEPSRVMPSALLARMWRLL